MPSSQVGEKRGCSEGARDVGVDGRSGVRSFAFFGPYRFEALEALEGEAVRGEWDKELAA